MITLTNSERIKFSTYLRQEAQTAENLAKQTLPGMEAIAKKTKTRSSLLCISSS